MLLVLALGCHPIRDTAVDTEPPDSGTTGGTDDTDSGAGDDTDPGGDTDVTDTDGGDTDTDPGGDTGESALVAGSWTGDVDVSDGVALTGQRTGDWAGWAVAPAGDFDGDGVDDVVVTAPLGDETANASGAVYLVRGPITSDRSLRTSDLVLGGPGANAEAGWSVDVGDVNGDGHADLLVGTYYENEPDAPGELALFFGPRTGSVAWASADARLTPEAGTAFGRDVEDVGDLDGDGVDDLAIADVGYTDGGTTRGAMYTVRGGSIASGAITSAASGRFYGKDASAFGVQVHRAGDADGDGLADVWVVGIDPKTHGRAAYLLLGPADGVEFGPDAAVASIAPTTVSWQVDDPEQLDDAGDVDGDGYEDVVIGDSAVNDGANGNEGAVYVFHGPFTRTLDVVGATATFTGHGAQTQLGGTVHGVGDVDGDGVPDLMAGAAGEERYGAECGGVFLLPGDSSGRIAARDAATAAFYGSASAAHVFTGDLAGDVDSDGIVDLIVGGFGAEGDASQSGAAWILGGGAGL